MAQKKSVEKLTKKQIESVFSILSDKEMFAYICLYRDTKNIMSYFRDNVYEPVNGIWVKKVEKGSRTFYLIYDWSREILFIIRDDSNTLELKIKGLMDRILGAVKEQFNIKEKELSYFATLDLVIYTKGVKPSEVENKATFKHMKFQSGSLGFWAEVYKDDKGGVMVRVNDRTIAALIDEDILKEYKSLNEILPA